MVLLLFLHICQYCCSETAGYWQDPRHHCNTNVIVLKCFVKALYSVAQVTEMAQRRSSLVSASGRSKACFGTQYLPLHKCEAKQVLASFSCCTSAVHAALLLHKSKTHNAGMLVQHSGDQLLQHSSLVSHKCCFKTASGRTHGHTHTHNACLPTDCAISASSQSCSRCSCHSCCYESFVMQYVW